MILDENGRPVDPRANASTAITDTEDGFPSWVQGVAYRADDDVITLRVHVPASDFALRHLLALEMTPEGLRVLLAALQRCLTQSEKTMQVLDVSDPASSR